MCLDSMWRNQNSHETMVEMKTHTTILKSCLVLPTRDEHMQALWPAIPFLVYYVLNRNAQVLVPKDVY